MKKVLFIVVLFCISQSPGFAQISQSVITGKVINKQSGQPVSDVNVFLSQTTLGTATDKDGTFMIQEIPNGIYNLVFSHVGFKTEAQRIKILKSDSVHYQVYLRPFSTELKGIVVTAERDHEWLENLELFKREFLGTSKNADKTLIKNPEVLSFKWNGRKTKLIASSPQELHIVNNALGYEVFLVLEKFVYEPSIDNYRDKVLYLVYPRYKELRTKNNSQKRKWIRNRKEAYTGSMRHFMRSLYHNKVNDEQFDIKYGSIDNLEQKEKEYLLRYELVSSDYKKKLKAFKYSIYSNKQNKRAMAIQYQRDDPSFFFPAEQNTFFIDEFGNVLNPESIFVGGNWHTNRIAETLPLNYTLTN